MKATDHVCLRAAKAHRKIVGGASSSSQWHPYANDRCAYMDIGNGTQWVYDGVETTLWIDDPMYGLTQITNNTDLDAYRRSRRNLERITNDSR